MSDTKKTIFGIDENTHQRFNIFKARIKAKNVTEAVNYLLDLEEGKKPEISE